MPNLISTYLISLHQISVQLICLPQAVPNFCDHHAVISIMSAVLKTWISRTLDCHLLSTKNMVNLILSLASRRSLRVCFNV